jgi:hypothetical protein
LSLSVMCSAATSLAAASSTVWSITTTSRGCCWQRYRTSPKGRHGAQVQRYCYWIWPSL